jgi:hypothetical protein
MSMHAVTHTSVIPGTSQKVSREGKEWKCPECDYFEEIDPQDLKEKP